MQMNNPRQTAKEMIKESVPTEVWLKNQAYVSELQKTIARHPVTRHPAIEALNNGVFDKKTMKKIHLEYRHAIVQIFTDALLMAQHQSRQVEPRLVPGSKMYARFLLTLNDLDEFGFRPGEDTNGYYRGNPGLAHYPLFERLLDDYGIGAEDRRSYQPTEIATTVREFLEGSYGDFSLLVALLAVAEEEVVLYSPPLRKSTAAVGLNVVDGYYHVHGTSDEKDVNAFDDDHEDDLWHIVNQAIVPAQYDEITQKAIKYCDLWCDFWDEQIKDRKDQKAA